MRLLLVETRRHLANRVHIGLAQSALRVQMLQRSVDVLRAIRALESGDYILVAKFILPELDASNLLDLLKQESRTPKLAIVYSEHAAVEAIEKIRGAGGVFIEETEYLPSALRAEIDRFLAH